MKREVTIGRAPTPAPLPDPETALRHVSRGFGQAWRCVLEIEAREAREVEEADARRAATATTDERGTQDDDKAREG